MLLSASPEMAPDVRHPHHDRTARDNGTRNTRKPPSIRSGTPLTILDRQQKYTTTSLNPVYIMLSVVAFITRQGLISFSLRWGLSSRAMEPRWTSSARLCQDMRMFDTANYELIDFGEGRKLEKFGSIVVDRPSPSSTGARASAPSVWRASSGTFEKLDTSEGRWRWKVPPDESWSIRHEDCQFRLKPTPFGHIGLFVEQAGNWAWIMRQTKRFGDSINVLNLFAYTGGSTLAAAAHGANVYHVDSSKSVVRWARDNAEQSGMSTAPVHWIVEDARKFVRREAKRGRHYTGIILDPPSYGHGPKGEAWKIHRDLGPLLSDCRKLLNPNGGFLCLSCHSAGFGAAELSATLADSFFGTCSVGLSAKPLGIKCQDGRTLPSGVTLNWSS